MDPIEEKDDEVIVENPFATSNNANDRSKEEEDLPIRVSGFSLLLSWLFIFLMALATFLYVGYNLYQDLPLLRANRASKSAASVETSPAVDATAAYHTFEDALSQEILSLSRRAPGGATGAGIKPPQEAAWNLLEQFESDLKDGHTGLRGLEDHISRCISDANVLEATINSTQGITNDLHLHHTELMTETINIVEKVITLEDYIEAQKPSTIHGTDGISGTELANHVSQQLERVRDMDSKLTGRINIEIQPGVSFEDFNAVVRQEPRELSPEKKAELYQEAKTLCVGYAYSAVHSLPTLSTHTRVDQTLPRCAQTHDLDTYIHEKITHTYTSSTSKPDYAAGGIIKSASESVCSLENSEKFLPFQKFLRKIWTGTGNVGGPQEVISPGVHLGRCWGMAGSKGYIHIQLAQTINVQEITLEHVPASIVPDNRTAPRQFRVVGITPGGEEVMLLGDTMFAGAGSQTYATSEAKVSEVRLEILSNHGAQNTCVYGLRVHGN